jgi:hypothetical protein
LRGLRILRPAPEKEKEAERKVHRSTLLELTPSSGARHMRGVGWFVFASLVASATQVSSSDPDFIVLNTYVPNNGDDWDMQDRRRVWDKEAMTFGNSSGQAARVDR